MERYADHFGRKPILTCESSRADWQEAFDALEYKRAKYYLLWRILTKLPLGDLGRKNLRDRLN